MATPTVKYLKYVNGQFVEDICSEYTLVVDSTSVVVWTSGYYVVGADYNDDGYINADDAAYAAENALQTTFSITGGASVSGDVKLILADGFTLSVDASASSDAAGICIQGGDDQFTVYGQAASSGKLTATGGSNAAGIGGGNGGSGSNITIDGGTVTATGGANAAGIGGGNGGSGSNITIDGGTVTATGGVVVKANSITITGAGIGGGNGAAASDITISGGVVNASSDSGAAIGSGAESSGQGGASNITISGGVVNASSNSGAGIGSGSDEGTEACSGVTISGGVVNASSNSGAGIGGGKEAAASDITISGGEINASSNSGAGIGGGESKTGDNIQISGGVVNASSNSGAGIGAGEADSAGVIEISDGIVYAVSTVADAIGSGDSGGGSGGVYVDVDCTVRAGTSAGDWDYVSEAGDHTEYDDLAGDLEGKHYASVAKLSDGSEYQKSAHYDCTNTRVENFAGGTGRMLIGGKVLSSTQELQGSYAISIGSGKFDDSVGCGSAAKGGASVTQEGDVTLRIEGGTFAKRVAGGMYVADNSSTVYLKGNVNLSVNGGTFNGRIYGGCNAQKDSLGENSTIEGDVSVTVNSSENEIHIGDYLIGGSRGQGSIIGNVTVTFTGDGKKLIFNSGTSIVAGGSNADFVKIDSEGERTISSAVSGSRNLVFDNFSGDFGADLRLFSTATFKNNSEVTLTDDRIDLWSIDTWNFEAGSSLAGLQANDFKGDTINFNLTGWDETTEWTAASGSVEAFDDLNLAKAVYFGTSMATYDIESACWTDNTYKLALNSNQTAMIVSKIA